MVRLAEAFVQLQVQRPEVAERSKLLAAIESEIIPRLMIAHRADPLCPAVCAASRLPPSDAEVDEFARIAARHDLAGSLAFIESMCRQGLSLELILLELIGPTARLLGDQWLDDRRSFTEVSAGLGTLQQLVHVLSPSFAPSMPHRGLILLTAAPGEQHTLGLFLVGEFLRRAGYGVQIDPGMSESELLRFVATERVELLGISVSNEALLKPLAGLLGNVRKASKYPGTVVALGGSLDLVDYAQQHSAFLASDPRDVVRFLELGGTLREPRH